MMIRASSNYYYAEGGTPRGPVSGTDLRAMAAEGRIHPDTLVWTDGLANWVPYRDLVWADTPAIAMELRRRCGECGQELPEAEMVRLGSAWTCETCKPLLLQRWSERGAPAAGLAYAGVWARFVATMLDGLLLAIAYHAVYVPVMWSHVRRMRQTLETLDAMATFTAVMVALSLCSIAMHALYEIWMVGRFGATLGKMVLRLRVVRADGSVVGYGRAAGRHFAKYLSQLTIGIGYVLALWDREKRALHDMVADTRVIKVDCGQPT